MTDFLQKLRIINSARLKAWEGDNPAEILFHATELGGEVGELLNVAKKLHREAMGWRGSRATQQDLADEIADVMICLDKLAAFSGVDIEEATTKKFDATSDKVGLPQKLGDPIRCDYCGSPQGGIRPNCIPPFTVQPHSFSGER